ncbi:MAG: DegT/DnrJ/EryC1/StrS family aminotransferase [Candidatus Abyssobacteria bacterium SURF_17]|uniref:DegT/DnrJ/EryC1/StrS family aminotransferase n=1 Tax=Candidatus Abyssobacteria bacterium SURF_17 TaxID=2093361 RepID=A0A419ERH2_9BACT|nr:MAG: DegT/DnrJ/EryC1/StrS family aminotransferase [Candidatus Abyssubacteria bacterium SURF_17]
MEETTKTNREADGTGRIEPSPWPVIDDEVIEAVVRVLKEESLSPIMQVGTIKEFEDSFAHYQGRKFAFAVNSGTAALDTALHVSGVGPGDEVIVSPYTWGATVGCILHNNAIPVFADIDPLTFNIRPDEIQKKITDRTKAIVTVHIYGHPCDMDPINEIARKHNIRVIEDCAQAHGATYKGKKVGSLGDIGCFSIQASKNLIGGEGGILVFDDEALFDEVVSWASHPVRQFQELSDRPLGKYIDSIAPNFRMHPVSAAIANVQLKRLDTWLAQRQKNLVYLTKALSDIPGIRPTYVAQNCTHAVHMIPLTYKAEELNGAPLENFRNALALEGIETNSYVNVPIHLRPRFQEQRFWGKGCPWTCGHAGRMVEYKVGDCPVAEKRCSGEELCLPSVGFHVPCNEYLDHIVASFKKAANQALAGSL